MPHWGRGLFRVLDEIVLRRGKPQSIRCDNGPELTSRHFLAWCLEHRASRRLAKLVSTSSARHSRVNASTTLSTRIVPPPAHHGRNPEPIPGWLPCAAATAFPLAYSASASSGASTARLRDTPGTPACGSPPRRFFATAPIAVDSRNEVSRALTASIAGVGPRRSPPTGSDS